MAIDTTTANEVWSRYTWLRDNGHLRYVQKATTCENFFAGVQWDPNDMAMLRAQRRPALTINKIISTVSNVLGEQIFNRTDIAFKPRNEGATAEVADALTKVFMQIADNNQLDWVRSDVFCDGIVTSRGYFDVRLDFTDSMRGEVRIEQLNPKNVLVDADADEYDPDKWGDVIITKWLSFDQIELLYSKKAADEVRATLDTYAGYGADAIDRVRDRFGLPNTRVSYPVDGTPINSVRSIRVLERQHRRLDMARHFVDLRTGDTRMIPSEWEEPQIQQYLSQNPDIFISKKLTHRIRWTVVAGNVVLHDDWSPYQHFTVVPYFPYFRRGTTVGLVENLIGPQELLNKVSSQELHVVNTTANSGWKIKTGALRNMSTGELENRGAQTGLVLELDDINSAEKIQPNQTPSGLDRISYKAEEHIKSISGVSDYMQGFAREDVAAKSVMANKQSGSANLAKVMDNMRRTDHILARTVLSIVQEYYTEERLVRITTDKLTNRTEELTVNQMTPEGMIVNDLTMGEYSIVVTNQPDRDTFEESQFDQAVRLRTEAGVQIPDKFIIMSSRLKDKAAIVQAMEGDQNSPEAQAQARLAQRQQEAQVAALEAEVEAKRADTVLKQAKAQQHSVLAEKEAITPVEGAEGDNDGDEAQIELLKMQQEFQLKKEQMDREFALKKEQMDREFALKQREMQLKQAQAQSDQLIKARQAEQQAAQQKPPTPTGAQ